MSLVPNGRPMHHDNTRTPPAGAADTHAPSAVIDSNAVLAWLWFDDPALRPLAAAVTGGRLSWRATPAMRDELAHVLQRKPFVESTDRREQVLTSMYRWARWDAPAPTAERLRCSDDDDQKFIDLAAALPARWLITRDRAVLRLARRAAALGLSILTPERWAEEESCGLLAQPTGHDEPSIAA